MIQSIRLQNIATYTKPGGVLADDLKKVNFFYGANGSGKTTIGRIIDSVTPPVGCEVNWAGGNPLSTFVYNQDFVRENIYQSDLAGIFTIGADAKEKEEAIAAKRSEMSELTKKKDDANADLIVRETALTSLVKQFRERCWDERKRYEEEYGFGPAFTGVRGDSKKLYDRLLNDAGLPVRTHDIAALQLRGESVYAEDKVKQTVIPLVPIERAGELERSSLLGERIVGKGDVDISALISQLGISDWVRRGKEHLEHSGDQCPFCQQPIEAKQLQAKIASFFDDSYTNKLQELNRYQSSWKEELSRISNAVKVALALGNQFLNESDLLPLQQAFEAQAENIVRVLDSKIERPGREVELGSIQEVLRSINEVLDTVNVRTLKHNRMIDDIAQQRSLLDNEVWEHFRGTLAAAQTDFQEVLELAETKVSSLRSGIIVLEKRLYLLEGEVLTLERQTTSTGPTIQAINKQLQRFGFTTFRLEEASRTGFYQIVRQCGAPATETLSEAERTFLAFLYFCESIKGGTPTTSNSSPKVVVFDDPVSSLDGNILSIVSTLIREIMADVIKGHSIVKQVFLLTHNVYFHKEVTYGYKKKNSPHFCYWMVKRDGMESDLERYAENPISSSYELLWQEFAESSGMGKQNIMRRILEHYFKVMGGMEKSEILNAFPTEKRPVCKSLFSWVNDGSHSVMDDLFISPDANLMQLYETVFKDVFVELGHEHHYDMMMGRFAAVAA